PRARPSLRSLLREKNCPTRPPTPTVERKPPAPPPPAVTARPGGGPQPPARQPTGHRPARKTGHPPARKTGHRPARQDRPGMASARFLGYLEGLAHRAPDLFRLHPRGQCLVHRPPTKTGQHVVLGHARPP